jgi:hypothetical protein
MAQKRCEVRCLKEEGGELSIKDASPGTDYCSSKPEELC